MFVLIGSIAWSRVLIIGLIAFFLLSCIRRRRPGHAFFFGGFGLALAAVIFAAIALFTTARDREQRRAVMYQNASKNWRYETQTGSRHFGGHGDRIGRRVSDRFGHSAIYFDEEEESTLRDDSRVPATIQIKLQPAWIESTGIDLDELANGLAGAVEFVRERAIDTAGEGKVNIVELSKLDLGNSDTDSPLRLGDVARPIREQSPAGRESRDMKLEIKVERGADGTPAFAADELATTLARVKELINGLARVNVTQSGDRLIVSFAEEAEVAEVNTEEVVEETAVARATTDTETSDNKSDATSSTKKSSDNDTTTGSTSTTAVLSATDVISVTRPDWVDFKDGFIPEKNVYRMIGTSAELENKDEAAGEWVVDDILYRQTLKYVIDCLDIDPHDAHRMPMMSLIRDPEWKNGVVKQTWVGPAHVESETVAEVLADNDTRYYQLYALCEFDKQTRGKLTKLWRSTKIERQLWYAGTGAGLVFALLATLLGYLKLDTKTRGYYSGRLKLAAGAVGTAVVAAAWTVFMAI